MVFRQAPGMRPDIESSFWKAMQRGMGEGPKKQVYLFYHIFCGFSKFRESYTNLLQNGCARGKAVRQQQRAHVGGQGGTHCCGAGGAGLAEDECGTVQHVAV